MVVWTIAGFLAVLFFFRGESILFLVFAGLLERDAWGFVGKLFELIAFGVKYFLPVFVLVVAFRIRNWQQMRLQSMIMGAPRCPRCGRRMVFRTAGLGFFFWEHFWGCSRFPFCRGREEIEACEG